MKKNIHQTIGIILFIFFFLSHFYYGMESIAWVEILIELAVLVLVPIGLITLNRWQSNRFFWLISAVLFTISYFIEPSPIAGVLAVPWILFAAYLVIQPLTELFSTEKRTLTQGIEVLTFLFLSIGGAWAFADRISFRPLDFEPIIVLLTVAHFHYAGFLLALITTLALENQESSLAKIVGWFVIAGTPLVATGITTTQLGMPFWIEIVAVTVMALGGMGVGFLHFKRAKGKYNVLWKLGAIGLFCGMILAMMYGWRYIFPNEWLAIPKMYAYHGTANSVSLGLILLGYYLNAPVASAAKAK
ncbi:MAG: hypothetical protein ACI85O_002146 [Saprospiraceae bacterium]|jgi:hypothetical protein